MEEYETLYGLELNEWADDIHDNAKKHGWWETPRSFAEIVALCHSELSEALEEERNNKPNIYFYNKFTGEMITNINKWDGEKLEGRATEMIDCIIRILDWCGHENIDVQKIMAIKHSYNKTRPYKHGGKKL